MTIETQSERHWTRKRLKQDKQDTQLSGLVWRGFDRHDGRATSISWTKSATSILSAILRDSGAAGSDQGKMLPYSSLRSVIEARVPNILSLRYDLGKPWLDGTSRPFLQALCKSEDGADLVRSVSGAVAQWASDVLFGWADRLEIDLEKIERVQSLSREGRIVEPVEATILGMPTGALDAHRNFAEARDTVRSLLIEALQGQELFAGLGPVHRIISSSIDSNTVEFETWPVAGRGGSFSMVCSISIETMPWKAEPYIVVNAGKRIWLDRFPRPGELFGRKRITARLMVRGTHRASIAYEMSLKNGVPETDCIEDPAFLAAILQNGIDIAGGIPDVAGKMSPDGNSFIAIPYSTKFGRTKVPRGATAQDLFDLNSRVAELLAGYGFSNIPFDQVDNVGDHEEYHKALKAEILLNHAATELRLNNIDDERVAALFEELVGEKPDKKIDSKNVISAGKLLAEVRSSNTERISSIFTERVQVVFISRTSCEADLFTAATRCLFSNVDVVRYSLPPEVHGVFGDGSNKKRFSEKFESRVNAWKPIAEQIASAHPRARVIVQVEKDYADEGGLRKRQEDPVNKPAGRYALARFAGANVQYLLPLQKGGATEYLIRLQAALYDLLFGHSGMAPAIGPSVQKAFPHSSNRPDSILGFSVIRKARIRRGGASVSLVLASLLDVNTGAVSAVKVSTASGESSWLEFGDALVHVASQGVTEIGKARQDEAILFQSFVANAVREVVRDGRNPLVMIDATSAQGLWPWLNNSKLDGLPTFGREGLADKDIWENLTVVRVRTKSTPRILRLMRYRNTAVESGEAIEISHASATKVTVRVSGESTARGDYVSTRGWQRTQQVARGLSAYRTRTRFQASGKADDGTTLFKQVESSPETNDSVVPESIEITVARTATGVDSNAVAALVASLRTGYAHTAMETTLPAPLSFRSKFEDYMSRHGVDDLEEVDSDPVNEVKGCASDPPIVSNVDLEPTDADTTPIAQLPTFGQVRAQLRAGDLTVMVQKETKEPANIGSFGNASHSTAAASLHISTADQSIIDDAEIVVDPELLNKPVVRVPGVATPDWFQSFMNVTPRDIRALHERYATHIRRVTGFPWPEQKPTTDQFFGFLPEAVRYPLFMRCLTFCMSEIRDVPIIKRYFQQYRAERDRYPSTRFDRTDPAAQLVDMIKLGARHELAIAAAILDWSVDLNFGTVNASRLASMVPEIADYLHDMARYNDSSYEARLDAVDIVSDSPIGTPIQGGHPEFEEDIEFGSAEDTDLMTPVAVTVEPTTAHPTQSADLQLREIVTRWQQDLQGLIFAANHAASAEPNETSQRDIESITARLHQHLDDYERIRPRGVQTQEIVSRLLAIANELVLLSEGYLAGSPDKMTEVASLAEQAPPLSTENSVRRSEDIAKDCEADLSAARHTHKTLDDLSQKKLPMIEFFKLAQEPMAAFGSVVTSGFERVSSAISALESVDGVRSQLLEARPILSESEESAVVDDGTALLSPADDPNVGPTDSTLNGDPPDIPESSPIEVDEDDVLEQGFDQQIDVAVDQKKAVEGEDDEQDLLLRDICRKSDELFSLGEFGLGYHLVNAAKTVLGDDVALPYSAEEMRLYALGARMPILSGVVPEDYHQAIEASAAIASHLGDDERADARRIALMASVLPIALLQVGEAGNAFNIIDTITTNDRCSSFFYLVELLKKNRSLHHPVSVASLRAASSVNADKSLADEHRRTVLEQINLIKNAQFRFVLGQKVLRSLTSKGGLVSTVETAVNQNDVAALQSFFSKYSDRSSVTTFLDTETKRIGPKQSVDGGARERLTAYITDLAAACRAYAIAAGHADEIRDDRKRLEQVRDLAENLKTGIRNFNAATAGSTGVSLIDSAYTYARAVLGTLDIVVQGKPLPEIDRKAVNFELHAPLLWLPGMAWSGAWTPSPKDAVRLISAICDLSVPRVRGNLADAAETAIEARRAEDAFVPAKMLLTFASLFGIDPVREENLRATIVSNEITRKAQVKARHGEVSKLIAKVRRMALGGLEQSTRLSDELDEIEIDVSQQDIPDFMPEEIDGYRVLDVNAAMSRLKDIEQSARHLLDEAKAAVVVDIDRMFQESQLSQEERDRLLKLVDSDDLATVADWIQTFNSGSRRPALAGPIMNEQLDRFNKVLIGTSQIDLAEAQRCIREGASYGSFDFAPLDDARRQEAAKTLGDWIEFKRRMKNPREMISQIGPHIPVLLSSIGYKTDFVDEARDRSNPGRQIFVADVQMNVPSDPTSLMLPEFGSLTRGAWRVAAVGATATTNEIITVAEGAEPRGTLVLMFGLMSHEKRRQLKRECVRSRRKVLVIDEGLLLYYLATSDSAPLGMFEIAQAFTTATPYQDYARSPVPNEMFKGRAREKAKILEPYGSYIVYGGRRLGKTALLRHISRNAPDHALLKFIDLNSFPLDLFWQQSSEVLKEIFSKAVNSSDEFIAGVKEYLNADNRRRILLMLDEADNFIKHEASQEYRDVVKLLNLMAETDHRFKFVLAGLHNVSRIAKSENSPLAQISNDPIRIGPLLQEDVADAEILMRGPMSALGFEFENREDVWRILSFTNYYPVLIQVFCKGLLDIIENKIRDGQSVRSIDGNMVDDALRNPQIRKLLYEAFDKTITGIEQRYGLLTYIIAYDAYFSSGRGIEADGLSAIEVTESATKYWPQAFPKGSDPSEIEYLLDEMEGFGILRRTPSKKWTLRSRMLLDLLVSSEEDLTERLLSYDGNKIEQQFDPKNARRGIEVAQRGRPSVSRISPLTDGQLSQIFSPSADDPKVVVIFGSPAAGIGDVVAAIEATGKYPGGERRNTILEIRGWSDRDNFVSELRRNPSGRKRIVIVPPQTSWRHDWVTAVSRLPSVLRGDVRPVFVGGLSHARAWAEAFRKSPSLSRIKIETLRPWARSFLATRLDALHLIGSIEEVIAGTEGWGEPTQDVVASLQRGAKVRMAVDQALANAVKHRVDLMGIDGQVPPAFVTLASWCGETGIGVTDLKEALALEVRDGGGDPDSILRLASIAGLVSLSNPSASTDQQTITMDTFVRRVLLAGESK